MEIKVLGTGCCSKCATLMENPRSRDPRAHLDLTL